ncbi:MAG: S1C family serine protease [Acidobacteriota bacterium]
MKARNIVWLAALIPAIALADPNPQNQQSPSQDQQDNQNQQPRAHNQQAPETDIESETLEWSSGHARLGVMVMGLTPELRTYFGAPRDAGLLVASVQQNGPAARAGVRVGDVITKIDNDRIQDATDIISALPQQMTTQRTVSIEVVRDHNRVDLQAQLGKRMRPQPQNQGSQL